MIRKIMCVILSISLFILNVQYAPSASAEAACPSSYEGKTVYQERNFCVVEWQVNELYIIGYIGNETDVEIPDTLKIQGVDKTVRYIDNEAFQNKGLTSVKLPQFLKYIGVSAFENNHLTSIEIPNSVEVIANSVLKITSLKV